MVDWVLDENAEWNDNGFWDDNEFWLDYVPGKEPIFIAGLPFRKDQFQSLNTRSPKKEQYRTRGISGVNREVLNISYTHRYILRMQSLSRREYINLYNKLLELDQEENGQVEIQCIGEIRAGIVHIPNNIKIPDSILFDFDITAINPDPKSIYYNMTIPLSVYVAV